ncbi:MAG: hypothetical protein E6J41_30930 [Chloroflexi bacterium]|nr:MAG: hypothetical protein E6J41_30930 [Chloroflexota bacterium]
MDEWGLSNAILQYGSHPSHLLDRPSVSRLLALSGLTALVQEGTTLAAVVIDPDDVPPVEDVEDAVMRLRRSYSTTLPLELEQRVNTRLQQVRRLLAGQVSRSARHNLAEAAAWLVLLRGTVQFDSRQHEAAWTSARAAQQLARDVGHRDLEAWTFETMAWMAATDNRQFEARELASAGIVTGPPGGFGLVAATLQRARIHGAMGDWAATMHDLRAGERALAAAGEATFPDDHYEIDPAKARFFASGAWAQLRRPAETIENAAEVVKASEDPRTRNYWPMRVANARVEWAMALTDLGDEDEAAALAALALEPLWLRPDTERRMRALLARMRDARLRSQLADRMHESQAVARVLSGGGL